MYNFKRFKRTMRKTFKNKMLVVALVSAGALVASVSGDVTFLGFILMFSLPMFMAKEDWFYKPED